jgi:DNA-binding GntR family transcriptional regulator
MDMEISPKEAISELKLASKIGMSRTPVREALRKLRSEGILTSYDKKGYFLNIPTLKEIKDIYEVRILLEGGAAKMAASKVDLRDVESFERKFLGFKNNISKQMKKKLENYGFRDANIDKDYVELGRQFHFFIVDSTGNKKLKELLENIYDHLNISRIYSYYKRREEAVVEHLKIVNALKERDGERSQLYMEEHLKNAFGTLIGIL